MDEQAIIHWESIVPGGLKNLDMRFPWWWA